MSPNPYQILGVPEDATDGQIRTAYKKLALETHPDRNPTSGERFREVNDAYQILKDRQQRKSYDTQHARPPPAENSPRYFQDNTRGQPFHSGFPEPSGIFNSVFGGPPHDLPNLFPFGFSAPLFEPFPPPAPFPFPRFIPGNSGADMGGGSFDPIFHTAPFIPPMMSGDLFHPQDTRNWGQPNSYFSSTSSYSVNRGRSESRSTSSINGLTTSVHEFVDSEGNTHTTTTRPDGSITYTINHIPQPSGQINASPAPCSSHQVHPYHNRRDHRHCHNYRGNRGRHRDGDRGYPRGYPDRHRRDA